MTTVREQIMQELDQTPDFVMQEVLDFLLFIKVRLRQRTQENQSDGPPQATSFPPFLQFIEAIGAQVPQEEWAKVPTDLSKNLDHYLYGLPKDGE
jgi:hypothetical protein